MAKMPNQNFAQPTLFVDNEGWFARNQRNKPQGNSAGAAAMIFASGGMHMAWSFGFKNYDLPFLDHEMRVSWFIAVILGLIFGAFTIDIIRKKVLIIASTALVTIGGILLVSLPQNYAAIIAARYLDGMGNGLVFVPTFVLLGEEVDKRIRGIMAGVLEGMMFGTGIFISCMFTAVWNEEEQQQYAVLGVYGILSIVYGVMAFVIVLICMVESPLYYLILNQEEMALDCLRKLQFPPQLTTASMQSFMDLKLYFSENKKLSFAQSMRQALPTLIKLCICRGMSALSFSIFLSYAIYIASENIWSEEYAIAMLMYGLMRMLGASVSGFCVDYFGRKKLIMFGALICGGLSIGLITILSKDWHMFSEQKFISLAWLLVAYQFFAGIYVTPTSSYLSEAFPLGVKQYCIACSFAFEMLLQIIIILASTNGLLHFSSNYFYQLTILSWLYVMFVFVFMPETKQKTLLEAQVAFQKVFSMTF